MGHVLVVFNKVSDKRMVSPYTPPECFDHSVRLTWAHLRHAVSPIPYVSLLIELWKECCKVQGRSQKGSNESEN